MKRCCFIFSYAKRRAVVLSRLLSSLIWHQCLGNVQNFCRKLSAMVHQARPSARFATRRYLLESEIGKNTKILRMVATSGPNPSLTGPGTQIQRQHILVSLVVDKHCILVGVPTRGGSANDQVGKSMELDTSDNIFDPTSLFWVYSNQASSQPPDPFESVCASDCHRM
jgi:hypothetical protein